MSFATSSTYFGLTNVQWGIVCYGQDVDKLNSVKDFLDLQIAYEKRWRGPPPMTSIFPVDNIYFAKLGILASKAYFGRI
jgi:hypothetical protein